MRKPFRHQSRIRFVDTDASGRIHYTALFRQFEAAESEFLRELGVSYTKGSFNLPRVHAECDIKLALTHDDVIDVEVYLTKLGRSSMRLEFRVIKDHEEAATGAVVIVCMDRATQKAISIPEDLRGKFEKVLQAHPPSL